MGIEAPVVVLDACVLYSAPLRDFLLHAAIQGVLTPVWSSEILDEFVRNLLLNRPDLSPERLARTCALMNTHFPASCVDSYHAHLHAAQLPDPNDQHVLALAIEASASHILTFNLRDFPHRALAPLSIQAMDPDVFLAAALPTHIDAMLTALHTQAASTRSPPHTPASLLTKLAACGLNQTSATLATSLAAQR